MAILWNPGGNSINIKRNTTISYMKESGYVDKFQNELENIWEVAKITMEKLPALA